MDTNILVPIVIAATVMIPGIWALVNQAINDKKQNAMQRNMLDSFYNYKKDTTVQFANLHDDISYTKDSINDRIVTNIKYGNVADEIWEKMYEKPVIIRCKHCSSPNIITSLRCTQCGAPLK